MLSFYGDVGNQHKGGDPLVTRLGYEVRASAPLTRWLEADLYAIHGRLGVNERDFARNHNFESRITVGGLRLRYNFQPLVNRERVVEPFITVGFESVEFLTKTDLFDAQGRRYNYWSDGTIRDIAEDAPNASSAVEIQRDYTYESDVRELNRDGFGKYREQAFAIPVGIGARMDIGHGLDLRIGATMHFTTTDLIDGITAKSLEERKGNSANDRFLYSGVSIGYTIPMARKPKKTRFQTPLGSEELDAIVLTDDEDGDGVKDFADECPGTPAGVQVDVKGCPLDGDGDGVPDHLDDELNSAAGALVDSRGVTITDEAMLKAWLNWKDSANVNIVASRVESFGKARETKPPAKRVFVVKVGTHTEGISEELIQKILSIPDVRTIERGDTTFYVVGSFDAIPEALRRELELKGMGIQSVVMAEEGGKLIDVSKETAAERAKMAGMGAGDDSRDVIVRVQLGAFRNKLSKNIFAGIKDLVVIQGDDGLTRYYTGSFKQINPAAEHRVAMLLKGFEGAFLVAFREGKRITMKEAGARVTGTEDLRTRPTPGSVARDKVRYRVQVATFAGNVPMETMDQLLGLGDVEPISGESTVRYYYGSFVERREAQDALEAIKLKGFTDAFVVGSVNGVITPAEDADSLIGK
ncbi:MAG TPA: hypothetical protein PKY96_09015 [Flavobacteriales bacterium]|nr:hypothetical protein [Flavobacteriales bacterium]